MTRAQLYEVSNWETSFIEIGIAENVDTEASRLVVLVVEEGRLPV